MVTIAHGALDEPRSLLEAMRGVDQVYHVAGLTRAGRRGSSSASMVRELDIWSARAWKQRADHAASST